MKAIIYTRVSTDEQADSGLGLAAQVTACTAYATARGLVVGGLFSDAGVSGSTSIAERPGLVALLATVKRGDVVIVAKRDRAARGMVEMSAIEREIERRGARLVSAAGEGTEQDDIGGLIQRRVFDLVAEIEREMIRARTKAAMAVKRERGERVSGAIPYGYTLAPDGVQLVANEREQEVIALVLSLRADGVSFRRIVDHLNNGITSRTGNRWHLRQVQNIIARGAA